MHVMRSYNLAVTTLLLSVTGAAAQLPPPTVVPPVPNPNPISSLVLPPTQQAPVSPAPGGVGREGLTTPSLSLGLQRISSWTVFSLLLATDRTGSTADNSLERRERFANGTRRSRRSGRAPP